MCVRSGVSVALKIYPKARSGRQLAAPSTPHPAVQKSLSPLNLLQVQREQAIHSRLSHAHVLDLYAVFEDADAFYFVMQFIRRGDLFHELKRSGGCFSEKCAHVRRAAASRTHAALTGAAYGTCWCPRCARWRTCTARA